MRHHWLTLGSAAAAVLLALCSPGFGATIANGTFGFGGTGGVITYTPSGSILNATTITIPTPNASTACGIGTNVCDQITSIPATYLTLQNDFDTGGNTPLNILDDVTFDNYAFDLTFGNLPVLHFTTQNSDRFTFTATSAQKNLSALGSSSFVNVAYLGNFADSQGFYDPALGSLAITFSQTGGNTGTVGYSATFATPPLPTPPTQTPEPTTMAMMGGALIGLGLVGRKRWVRR